MNDQEVKTPCNAVTVILPGGKFADQDAHAFTDWVPDPKDPSWLSRRCVLCLTEQRRKVAS